jgi:WD40 repeat protein
VSSGREIHAITELEAPVVKVAFGRYITSLDSRFRIRLWKPDGQLFHAFDGIKTRQSQVGPYPRRNSDFSPDATRLAMVSVDGGAVLWDLHAESARIRSLGEASGPVTFAPDGERFATWSQGQKVLLWGFEDLKVLRQFGIELEAEEGKEAERQLTMEFLAFNPDGSRIAAVSREGHVFLWDVASGRQVGMAQGPEGDVRAVVFLPDGGLRVASGGWNLLKTRDPKTGTSQVEPLLVWDAQIE